MPCACAGSPANEARRPAARVPLVLVGGLRAVRRLVPERRDPPAAAARHDGLQAAPLAVPELQEGAVLAGEHPAVLVARAARTLPWLRLAHPLALPAGRAPDRGAVVPRGLVDAGGRLGPGRGARARALGAGRRDVRRLRALRDPRPGLDRRDGRRPGPGAPGAAPPRGHARRAAFLERRARRPDRGHGRQPVRHRGRGGSAARDRLAREAVLPARRDGARRREAPGRRGRIRRPRRCAGRPGDRLAGRLARRRGERRALLLPVALARAAAGRASAGFALARLRARRRTLSALRTLSRLGYWNRPARLETCRALVPLLAQRALGDPRRRGGETNAHSS